MHAAIINGFVLANKTQSVNEDLFIIETNKTTTGILRYNQVLKQLIQVQYDDSLDQILSCSDGYVIYKDNSWTTITSFDFALDLLSDHVIKYNLSDNTLVSETINWSDITNIDLYYPTGTTSAIFDSSDGIVLWNNQTKTLQSSTDSSYIYNKLATSFTPKQFDIIIYDPISHHYILDT